MNQADQYIDRVSHLPPAPTVATELLGLFGDPNQDIDRIVELISHDPALTIEVLKRCNSAFFGGARAASDMFEAVTRLGFYEVYRVVAASVGTRTLALGNAKGGLDVGAFWRHSVVTAVAAENLARHLEEPEAVAFTAGLLHDIGKLVFSSVESSRYPVLVGQAGAFGPGLTIAEQAAFGVTHAAIGAQLLTRWSLPENVSAAVLHHHGPSGAAEPFERLAATIHLANNLAHHMFDQTPDGPDFLSYSSEAMTCLQLTSEDLPKLTPQIQAGLQRVKGFLHLTA